MEVAILELHNTMTIGVRFRTGGLKDNVIWLQFQLLVFRLQKTFTIALLFWIFNELSFQ